MEKNISGQPAAHLLDQSIFLLRSQGPSLLLSYYLCTIPFCLGFVYFWFDMSRSAFAFSRCFSLSLGVTVLFIWMKTGQTLFTRKIWLALGGQSARIDVQSITTAMATQPLLHSLGLILLIPALILTIPFPWLFAAMQSTTVLGTTLKHPSLSQLIHMASKHSMLWPKQNLFLMGILTLLFIFVFIDLLLAVLFIPDLLKILFAIQSPLLNNPQSYLNSTMFLVISVLCYLCIDPIVKTAYTIRCFEGESLTTGEALRARLARLQKAGCWLMFFSIFLTGSPLVHAQNTPPTTHPPRAITCAVDSRQLQRSIESTINHPKYTWRMSRELDTPPPQRPKTQFERWIENTYETSVAWLKSVWKKTKRFLEKITDFFHKHRQTEQASAESNVFGMMDLLIQILLYTTVGVLATALIIFTLRTWKGRIRTSELLSVTPVSIMPDLSDESTSADALPSEQWLEMAMEFSRKNEMRLAMRAVFLAGLAAMAQNHFIRIKKSKTNHDYACELRRRCIKHPELLDHFLQTTLHFERIWYGQYSASQEQFQDMLLHHERICSFAG